MRGNEPLSAAQAESLLQWWTDAGVDCLVDERPRDWLRPNRTAGRTVPAVTEGPLHHAAHGPSAAFGLRPGNPKIVSGGHDFAADPRSGEDQVLPDQLELFRAYLATSDALPFAAPAAPRVCPAGDPASGLMMLSDMPNAADCSEGALLSGPTGLLFDRMLAAIGRDRSSIYLASLSCLRPASGSFTSETATQCAELARHHIALAKPKAVLLLGDACAKALLGLSVIQARGRWHEISTTAGDIAALVCFHPSYLLDVPTAKRHAWADLQLLQERFDT